MLQYLITIPLVVVAQQGSLSNYLVQKALRMLQNRKNLLLLQHKIFHSLLPMEALKMLILMLVLQMKMFLEHWKYCDKYDYEKETKDIKHNVT